MECSSKYLNKLSAKDRKDYKKGYATSYGIIWDFFEYDYDTNTRELVGDYLEMTINNKRESGGDVEYAKGGGVGEKTHNRRYLVKRGRNVFTFGYGMPKDAIDMYGTVGGAEYYELPNGEVYKSIEGEPNKFILIRKK